MEGSQQAAAGGDRESAADVAREALAAERARPFRWLVRAGFVARAVTYGTIGALALALACGAGREPEAPNQQGALALIAQAPLGRVAIVVIALGLLAYALWKLAQACLGHGPEGGASPSIKDRLANLGGGLVYIAFFAVSVRVLVGTTNSGSSDPKNTAAGILGWPGGQVVVAIAGSVLIVVSAYQVYDAVRGSFATDIKVREMGRGERRAVFVLGRVGLIARALVFGVVGYFLLRSAIDFDAGSALGVDGALKQVHHGPLGTLLLGLVAAGLLTFGLFSLFEARYRRL